MRKYFIGGYLFFALVIVLAASFLNSQKLVIAADDTLVVTVKISVCGNGELEYGEECDLNAFGGQNCGARGFTGGDITCSPACEIDTSDCEEGSVNNNSNQGGGGGGGGGSGLILPPETKIILSGRAYPLSKITVLKDGQRAVTSIAGPDANFSVSLSQLGAGNYNFSVYGEDNAGRRSMLFNFPVYITTGATTEISGIFIAPTIALDKMEVKKGDNLAIFGQTLPQAQITIVINSEREIFDFAMADKTGIYLYNFDTARVEMGQHTAKSKTAYAGALSSFSELTAFKVGLKTIYADGGRVIRLKGDVNGDNKVNLIDFSVAAYWYRRATPPAAVDLNGDGEVSLIDFSVLAFHWTG